MTEVEQQKPRFALFIATAAGLGYLPKAPGTWGSLGGIILFLAISFLAPVVWLVGDLTRLRDSQIFLASLTIPLLATVSISLVGVWFAGKAANYLGTKDPQVVVIDEVSGQCVTLLLAESLPIFSKLVTADAWSFSVHLPGRSVYAVTHVNWINLLVGFILFRLFDIWKPFPARQAESLPGGWGIMADDWVAGIYAALGLWIARMLGL
jgi:phosphatidylglycerophosphatase A